jgi:hypothetical protein
MNKKKPPKDASPAHLNQQNTLPWLHSSQSARESVIGTLFSAKPAEQLTFIFEEPTASTVQALMNRATNVFECATGGHGRCVDSVCRCHCHKPRVPVPWKRHRSV